LIAKLSPEKRKGSKVFLDVSRHGAGRLDLHYGVVLARAWLVDEQVGLGVPASLKVRVSPLVYFAVESVKTILRPQPPHLVVELITIHALPIYRIGAVDRQKKVFGCYRHRCVLKNLR
jgi:hypothetical protein